MKLLRMFSNEEYKGTRNYIDTQKKYEIIRTALYFGISLALFIAGYVMTDTRMNLLTIVAVLGCLPASKSLVGVVMYLRYHSCSKENADKISAHTDGLINAFDMIFTAYDKNFDVAHITVAGNTICGFTEDANFDEQTFYKHIESILRLEHYTETSVKIFSDVKKYTERLEQMKELVTYDEISLGILNTLKSVVL